MKIQGGPCLSHTFPSLLRVPAPQMHIVGGVTNHKAVLSPLSHCPFSPSSLGLLDKCLTDLQGMRIEKESIPRHPSEAGGAELPPHGHLLNQSGMNEKKCHEVEHTCPQLRLQGQGDLSEQLEASRSSAELFTPPLPKAGHAEESFPVKSTKLPTISISCRYWA